MQLIFELSATDAGFASLLLEYEEINDDIYLLDSGVVSFPREVVKELRARRNIVNQKIALALERLKR